MTLRLLCLLLCAPLAAAQTWTPILERGDLRTALVLDDGTLLVGTATDGLRSTDGGASFDTLRFIRHPGTGDVPDLADVPRPDGIIDFAVVDSPDRPGPVVFAAGDDGGYRSLDGGATWEPGPPGLFHESCPASLLRYYDVAAAPDGRVFFSGTGEDQSPSCKSRDRPWYSTDAGETWVRPPAGFTTATGGMLLTDGAMVWSFQDIALLNSTDLPDMAELGTQRFLPSTDRYKGDTHLSTADGSAVYASVLVDPRFTTSSGIWRSDDGGAGWVQANGDLPTLNVARVHALANGRVLAGTYDRGVFVTDDGGATWAEASGGLVNETGLVRGFATGPESVWVVTASGLFRSGAFAVADEDDPAAATLTVSVGPNPARSRTTVAVEALNAGEVRVDVFDALGRRMAVLHDGAAAGALRLDVDLSAWAPGVYVVRAVSGEGQVTTHVTVTR